EQQMAYDIVQNHLLATKAGRRPKQLLMLLLGYSGTGKTVVINSIAKMFREQNVHAWLGVTATSGVAASLIDGVTLHAFTAL
ncbi:hypothetical protein C8J56DRAFT_724270, partial [Mycena floridula]